MALSPPRPKGPPLNALRAFEAAARHQNFTLAAAELCVTPGAIAQHVKQLEAWTGTRLFERHAHGVRLTNNGRASLGRLTLAFDTLGGAVQQLRHLSTPNELRIAALPSVAQLWVLPRLPALRRSFPKLTVSVVAMEEPPNLVREPYDLALFFQQDASAQTHQTLLSRASRFPVCAPHVARRLQRPSDLADETLLHDATWRQDWLTWTRLAGIDEAIALNGPVYSLYSLAVTEAISCAGVIIANEPLVEHFLRTGQLVRPFKIKDSSGPPLTASIRSSDVNTEAHRLVAWLAKSAGPSRR